LGGERDAAESARRDDQDDLTEGTAIRTLKEYAALLVGRHCRWCGSRLRKWVEHYDHSGGWEVSGFLQRQWLYTTCPKCKYQWNLGKLGIAR
jgi:hypothetical protein